MALLQNSNSVNLSAKARKYIRRLGDCQMKKTILLLLTLLLAASGSAQTRTPASVAVAFVDVNVIPMAPEWLMLYGHTLHLELVDLRDAGLSNYAALEAATRNPALFFGKLSKTGTIEKGKNADLLMLEANPLEDIANTQKRVGVMLKGKYYPQVEMNQWLDKIAPRFQKALDEQK